MNNYQILHGDCKETLKTLPDNSVDSIVTDPPYELGFMNKGWDKSGIANSVELWAECLRVLKPGGHLLAFSGTRTYHRMTCAIEDAGFEIRDQIQWVYGCYSEDTEVLTKRGFLSYTKLQPDDEIMQWDCKDNSLTWCKISEIYEYDAPSSMIHIKNRHTDQPLTKNHRVYYKGKTNGRYNYSEWRVGDADKLTKLKVLPPGRRIRRLSIYAIPLPIRMVAD
jgi:hypothetical protein